MSNTGRITFAYASNNGVRAIGAGDNLFETRWSNGSDNCIHAYNNRPSIEAIALAEGAARIADIRDAARFDYSDHLMPRTGQVVLLRNASGRYAAIQLLAIGSMLHGSRADEVVFRFAILADGSRDFSCADMIQVTDPSFARHVLLVGAGFSRNWGGLLASEMQEKIFGHPAVQARPRLKRLVLDKPFEDALEETRSGLWESEDQVAVEAAIKAAFEQMDMAIRNPTPPVLNATANDFIGRFCPGGVGFGTGYVFSLNQDLLFERIYGTIPTRQTLVVPGVTWLDRPPQFPAGAWPIPDAMPAGEDQLDSVRLLRNFNLIKLHGSVNWRAAADKPSMVMGRRKPLAISAHPLLAYYYQVFESVLATGDVKLMVIGYSWSDEHINDVVADAVRDHRLGVYSWNPSPAKDLIRPRHRGTDIIDGLVGYSTRPLTEVMPPTPTEPGSPEYDAIVRSFF